MSQMLETSEKSGKLWFKKNIKHSEFVKNHFNLHENIDRKPNVSSLKAGFPISSPKISFCFFAIVSDQNMQN